MSCAECGGTPVVSRGLCRKCYQKSWRRGECAKYQRRNSGKGAKTQTFISPNQDGSYNDLFDIESERWAYALLSPAAAASLADKIRKEAQS